MIRSLISATVLALGAALGLAAPASAQTFTHTVNGHTHSHDITTYQTVGTCCVTQHTCTGGHDHNHTHTTHAPTQYTHTVTSAPVRTVRTYSVPAPVTTVTRHVYVQPAPVYVHRPAPVYIHTPAPRPVYQTYSVARHDDRDRAWAHYDRGWKSRTNNRRHHRHDRYCRH